MHLQHSSHQLAWLPGAHIKIPNSTILACSQVLVHVYGYPELPLAVVQKSGSITYNGSAFSQFVPEQTATYVHQSDLHLPEITVRETFDFGARVQGAGHRGGGGPLLACMAAASFI